MVAGLVRLEGQGKVESVAQHKAQHTGDVSHLCSKEKTLGVERCVCAQVRMSKGDVFTTLPIGGFIYSMTHPYTEGVKPSGS